MRYPSLTAGRCDTCYSKSMSEPKPPSPAATPRRFRWRRLVQYRLRTLLILTTIVAVWFAWWSHTARQQREAVADFKEHKAWVHYDYRLPLIGRVDDPPRSLRWLVEHMGEDYFFNVMALGLGIVPMNEGSLEPLKNLTSLEELSLSNVQLRDAHMKHLRGLIRLKKLDLSWTTITDAGVENLQNLTTLETLTLTSTHITDDGLKHFRGLKSLEQLDLMHTNVTDAGLEYLRGLTRLSHLDLFNTNITDDGLKHLLGLTELRLLGLGKTQVTDAGAKRLQQALPHCTIIR